MELFSIKLEHCRLQVQNITNFKFISTWVFFDGDLEHPPASINLDPLASEDFGKMITFLPSLESLTLRGISLYLDDDESLASH